MSGKEQRTSNEFGTSGGRLGGLAVALRGERQSTTEWQRGAVGEELLGQLLDSITCEEVAVLHDRRIPRSRANVDHLAVTAAGVWVIDAKRYKGRLALRIEGGIQGPRVEKLLVGRRDCTKLVDGALRQVELVSAVVGDVPVTGALCFVDADWPLLGGDFNTRGVHVLWPRRLVKRLSARDGQDVDVAAVRESLMKAFPAA